MALLDAKSGDLVTYWKAQTGITALVGTATNARAYPEFAKEEASFPLLVYSVAPGGQSIRNLAGGCAMRASLVNVWAIADTRAGADALQEQVRLVTENHRGSMGSTTIYDVRATPPDTGADPRQDGSQGKDYWSRIVYEVWHSVTAA